MGIILRVALPPKGHHFLSCAAPNFPQTKKLNIIVKGRFHVGFCPALTAHAASALPIPDIVFVALMTALPG